MVPVVGFEPTENLLLRQGTLPICLNGLGAPPRIRTANILLLRQAHLPIVLVGLVCGEGVEPPMFTTEGSDLQSDATPPSLPPARRATRMVRQ